MPNLISLGQYRIEAELGSGRFSETYRVYDTVRRRPAALKLLHATLLDRSQAFRDFLSQAQQATELVHPYIAWIWETGEAEQGFFLVERFVNGPALAGKLAQTGTLSWVQACQVVDQIAQALEFAYSKGWVHGRVNSRNILLGPDQTAVLSDYGLQRALHASQISTILQTSTYDAQYLPPEVLQGQPASPATDQYALACTLLEMLAGKNPFAAPSLAEIEQKHATPLVEPLFPPENAPWQISRVLEQALSPEPGDRFKNAGEFVAALNHATSPGAIDPGELARRETQVQAWRVAEQQERLQTEESARLAALEQARREIQEQARREVDALELLEADAPSEEMPRHAGARRGARRPTRPLAWHAWVIAAIILVALASYWLDNRLSTGGLAQLTATATTVLQPVVTDMELGVTTTPTVSATVSSVPTQVFTPTASVKPSTTATHTSTPTKKPTVTPSSTPQPSPTLPPSSTFTPDRIEQRD